MHLQVVSDLQEVLGYPQEGVTLFEVSVINARDQRQLSQSGEGLEGIADRQVRVLTQVDALQSLGGELDVSDGALAQT